MKLLENEHLLFKKERTEYKALLEGIRSTRSGNATQVSVTSIGNAGGADAVSCGYPTGGMMIKFQDRTIIVDPGENSLSFLSGCGFDSYSVTDVVASHAHNDHVGDLSSFVSSALHLNMGGASDVNIIVPPTLIDYQNPQSTRFGFTLPAYAWEGHVSALHWIDTECIRFDGEKIRSIRSAKIGNDITVSSIPGRHGELPAGGLIFDTPCGRFSYTSDTEYFDELAGYYQGSDVLWMNMSALGLGSSLDTSETVPEYSKPVSNHLGYHGVCELIRKVRPKTAIVSHFGSHLLPFVDSIESMLRNRFADSSTAIYCAHTGDEFKFSEFFSETTQLTAFCQ